VAEERASYGSEDLEKMIAEKQKAMEKAAKNLDFIKAAKLRMRFRC
jgi:excinuclease ABC subunit B